jgi:hypothetical protein
MAQGAADAGPWARPDAGPGAPVDEPEQQDEQDEQDVLDVGPDGPRRWLHLPDVAELIGTDVGAVRRMLRDRELVGLRRGRPKVLRVPEELVAGGVPLPELAGTLIVLSDSGYSDEEALRWLFTGDPSLPGTPAEALRAGRKTEIRRRAQALAF